MEYGVYLGPKSLAESRDNPNTARWYYILRAAQSGDTFADQVSAYKGFSYIGTAPLTGKFNVYNGKLTIETGNASYVIADSTLKTSGNDGVTRSIFQPDKPDGTRLNNLELARSYVQKQEHGEHNLTAGDFHELALGYYQGIGAHLAFRRDRYGKLYMSLNTGRGVGGPAGSLMQGNILQSYAPDQGQLSNLSAGWGISFSGGSVIGGGFSAVDGPLPIQYGLTTPGFAMTVGFGWGLSSP